MPEKAKSDMLMAQTKNLPAERNFGYDLHDEKRLHRLPTCCLPQEPEGTPCRKYALLCRRFLKERRPVMFTNLLTTGRLNEHLMEIQQTAQRQVEQITAQVSKKPRA